MEIEVSIMFAAAVRSCFPFALAARREESRPASYALIDLGTCAEGSPLLPVAMNDSGAICVTAASRRLEGALHGFLVHGTQREPLGAAFGQAPAAALSARGLVAGAKGETLRELRAWASHLGVFGERFWPGSMSFVRGVNDAGLVTGSVWFDAGEFMLSRGFVFPPGGTPRFLTPPNGGTSAAVATNENGAVIFNSSPLGAGRDAARAWCLRDECYIGIAGLGGGHTQAHAITAQGRVVGSSLTANGATHGFLWEEGATRDLGTLADGRCEALAANDEAVVVGRVTWASGERRAFRWTTERGLHALDAEVELPRGWQLHEAIAINARGEIAGVGARRGRKRGFVLRPL